MEKWKSEDGDELRRYRTSEFIKIIKDGIEIKEFDIDMYFRMVEKIIISLLEGTEIDCIIE